MRSVERTAALSGQILRYRFPRLAAVAAVSLWSGAVWVNRMDTDPDCLFVVNPEPVCEPALGSALEEDRCRWQRSWTITRPCEHRSGTGRCHVESCRATGTTGYAWVLMKVDIPDLRDIMIVSLRRD